MRIDGSVSTPRVRVADTRATCTCCCTVEITSKLVLSTSDPSAMARELFQQIDVNGDGTLDRSEIAGLATRLGKSLSEAELTAAMKEMDVRTHSTHVASQRWQRSMCYSSSTRSAFPFARANHCRSWLK